MHNDRSTRWSVVSCASLRIDQTENVLCNGNGFGGSYRLGNHHFLVLSFVEETLFLVARVGRGERVEVQIRKGQQNRQIYRSSLIYPPYQLKLNFNSEFNSLLQNKHIQIIILLIRVKNCV